MAEPDFDRRLIERAYPLQARLGFEMTGWRADYARFELPLAPHLMNRYGIPHGGVYATLLDTVMSYAGCFTGDPDRRVLSMTLTMTTNFLSRPAGTRLIAQGHRIGGGKSTFFAEAQVQDDQGNLIATGSGTFRYRRSGPPAG